MTIKALAGGLAIAAWGCAAAMAQGASVETGAPTAPVPPSPTPAASASAGAGAAGGYLRFGIGQASGDEYSYDRVQAVTTTVDDGQVFEGAWGQDTGKLRFEIGGEYRDHALTSRAAGFLPREGDLTAYGLSLSGAYVLAPGARLSPYLGAGATIYNVSLDDGVVDDSGPGVGFNAGAGVALALGGGAALTLEGRYDYLSWDIAYNGDQEDTESVGIGGFGVRAGLMVRLGRR